MNKQITIVFPMGGKGQRFGNAFKPFLKIFDRTFLEHAIQPFLKHKDSIKEMIFLTTVEQDKEFNVQQRLQDFRLPIPHQIYRTEMAKGIIPDINDLMNAAKGEIGDVIFCDCDHSLNVDGIFEAIARNSYDMILPVSPLKDDEIHKWSVVSADDNGIATGIAEKQYPKVAGNLFWGVIGCYYFRKFIAPPSKNFRYISDVISACIEAGQVAKIVHITEAEFFGDPERLNNLYAEKRASTIFCDIDGTIIKHENVPTFTEITLLEGAGEKIKEWRAQNCFIILTTARDEQFRPEMEGLLRKAGITYEYLVMGLPPGPRYLINDKKPYSDKKMAHAFEVERDSGIRGIDILWDFEPQGQSFAEFTKDGDIACKHLPPDASDYQHTKFRAQYDSMKEVSKRVPELMPYMYNFWGDCYEMEYLEGYSPLHEIENKIPVLEKLFTGLKKLYVEAEEAPKDWLQNYLEEKIFSKQKAIEELGLDVTDIFNRLRNMTTQEYATLSPKFLTQIHGDLTYENIMVGAEAVKLIDFDNDNKLQPLEQDLGKLWQSASANYEQWDAKEVKINLHESHDVAAFYAHILGCSIDEAFQKAEFYCALHLFRMVTYQAKRSMARAEKALRLCKHYLTVGDSSTREVVKMEHFNKDIVGWTTFEGFYSAMVNKFPSGSRFIEVGVYEGRSFACLMVEMINAGKEFEVTAVDSFTFEDEHTRENILQVFKRNLRPVEGRYKIIEATSWLAAEQFEDGTLDFVFLDADHVYESVKKDIQAWVPKIRKGGILAGHDLCPEHPGVEQAVNEVFGEDWSKEYVDELVWMKQF